MSDARRRILLVDDEDEVREALRVGLEQQGYEVLCARDGNEALMRAERDAPDLIVLDIVMPRRTGFAVLDRLRTSPARSLPVVMITGNADPHYRRFADSLGVEAFVAKPFEIDTLIATIESLLS
ncbi:MAG: response regulator [Planctomycetaceae bacterium]